MENLTIRELQITEMRSHDMLPIQIADKLRISEHTVINHLKKVYSKLHVHSAIALTRWFIYNIELKKALQDGIKIALSLMFSIQIIAASDSMDMRRASRRLRRGKNEFVTLNRSHYAFGITD